MSVSQMITDKFRLMKSDPIICSFMTYHHIFMLSVMCKENGILITLDTHLHLVLRENCVFVSLCSTCIFFIHVVPIALNLDPIYVPKTEGHCIWSELLLN